MAEKLQTGAKLGNYQLLTELGRGGMASVWVARQRSAPTGEQRLVAVKAMLPRLASNPDFRASFLEEGQIARNIEHPNVVRIYEVGEDQGILYLAMEWVQGESLRTLIWVAKQRRAIPSEMAVRIIADVAAGLHAAHELRGWDGELRGLVHCDVSPHNVLLGVDGVAKLVDFGLAYAVAHSEVETAETFRGKFGYLSPEQARGQSLDRRADIFALGVVLFELTTGERLFRGRDRQHTVQLVLHGQIPRPSMLVPNYPPELEQIVLRALNREPRHRFQTAQELRHALEKYLVHARILVGEAGVGALVKRVLGERIEQRRQDILAASRKIEAPRRLSSHWPLFLLGTLLGVAAGVAAVLWALRGPPACSVDQISAVPPTEQSASGVSGAAQPFAPPAQPVQRPAADTNAVSSRGESVDRPSALESDERDLVTRRARAEQSDRPSALESDERDLVTRRARAEQSDREDEKEEEEEKEEEKEEEEENTPAPFN